MASTTSTSLPYHEPGIVTILILSSFLLLSNLINWALDRLVYCGLIGQILIGVAWGVPGGKWLDSSIETTIVQFGYLGLLLLVYEGGLATSFQSLKANFPLSTAIALTGIALPIALSFTLGGTSNASPLQSFAAGAALCSTSLGTTFTILGTTGLLKTRLGVVLTSAAMMDDVVGLVMVQVISNLGGSSSVFSTATVVRPVFVSLGFALVCPLVCWLVAKPVTIWLNAKREANREGVLDRVLEKEGVVFCVHTLLVVGMITGASYAGTSGLFAAYLAGAMISWWDSEVPHPAPRTPFDSSEGGKETATTPPDAPAQQIAEGSEMLLSGSAIYEKYYQPANGRILKPFFFTSIGFSIPITLMFDGPIVWRGIIYSILMLISKLLCGAWLIRFSLSFSYPAVLRRAVKAVKEVNVPHLWHRREAPGNPYPTAKSDKAEQESPGLDTAAQIHMTASSAPNANDTDTVTQAPTQAPVNTSTISAPSQAHTLSHASPPGPNPISLYPAAILGLAMVARGEIGFLISSLAESNGIFSASGHEQIFLIVTWAIVLCTIVGPVCVGLLVRRVRKLEKARGEGSRDVLGVWGVE